MRTKKRSAGYDDPTPQERELDRKERTLTQVYFQLDMEDIDSEYRRKLENLKDQLEAELVESGWWNSPSRYGRASFRRRRRAMEDSCGCQQYMGEEEEEDEPVLQRRRKRTPPRPPKLPKGRIPVRRLSAADEDGFARMTALGVADDIANWLSAFGPFSKQEFLRSINSTGFIDDLEEFLSGYLNGFLSNL